HCPTGNRASSTAGSRPRPTSGSRAAPRAGAVTRNGPPPQDEVLSAAGNCFSPAPPRPKKVLGLSAPQGPACRSGQTHQSSSGTHRGLPSRPRRPLRLRRPGDGAPPAAEPPAPLLLAARVRASHLPSSL
ncbi:rCG24409, partial [Rattus norvegicus]